MIRVIIRVRVMLRVSDIFGVIIGISVFIYNRKVLMFLCICDVLPTGRLWLIPSHNKTLHVPKSTLL